MDIPGQLLTISILLNQNTLIAALKQMHPALALCVIVIGIGAINVMKNLGEDGLWSL